MGCGGSLSLSSSHLMSVELCVGPTHQYNLSVGVWAQINFPHTQMQIKKGNIKMNMRTRSKMRQKNNCLYVRPKLEVHIYRARPFSFWKSMLYYVHARAHTKAFSREGKHPKPISGGRKRRLIMYECCKKRKREASKAAIRFRHVCPSPLFFNPAIQQISSRDLFPMVACCRCYTPFFDIGEFPRRHNLRFPKLPGKKRV